MSTQANEKFRKKRLQSYENRRDYQIIAAKQNHNYLFIINCSIRKLFQVLNEKINPIVDSTVVVDPIVVDPVEIEPVEPVGPVDVKKRGRKRKIMSNQTDEQIIEEPPAKVANFEDNANNIANIQASCN
ncbi:hypothetical protein BpHYR1_013238 [Brachionus plicatilis]|uniref:Uncharacterized protein n=1 Tax=Brachionus plicatilis TaxID=10195 RepID=A0A3M7S0P5_BRAPC|nr:hypothetical protein BpHYR1_013238 [Brachionus plicatilis]